jgi:hypothetical protein
MIWLSVGRDRFLAEPPQTIWRKFYFEDRFFMGGLPTQQGVPLNVIQEMGAWESSEIVKRYAHLAPEQFAKHARAVDDVLNGTNLAQQE